MQKSKQFFTDLPPPSGTPRKIAPKNVKIIHSFINITAHYALQNRISYPIRLKSEAINAVVRMSKDDTPFSFCILKQEIVLETKVQEDISSPIKGKNHRQLTAQVSIGQLSIHDKSESQMYLRENLCNLESAAFNLVLATNTLSITSLEETSAADSSFEVQSGTCVIDQLSYYAEPQYTLDFEHIFIDSIDGCE